MTDRSIRIMACGTCLKIRQEEGSEICPISTLKDLYELVGESDKVVTFRSIDRSRIASATVTTIV